MSHEACIATNRAKIEITPHLLEEFEDLFLEWKTSFPTADQLEAGGCGEVRLLAEKVLIWASDLTAS